MAENNPDILIPLLEEYTEDLDKWDIYSAETLSESERIQNAAGDCCEGSKYAVSLSRSVVEEKTSLLNQGGEEITQIHTKANNDKSSSESVLNTAKGTVRSAASMFEYWHGEFLKAKDWLNRAKERFSDAEESLADATQELERAKIELANAEAALEDCRNSSTTDKDGNSKTPPCTAEIMWVAKATAENSVARQQYQYAKHELKLASIELAESEDCAERCDFAKKLSDQFVDKANAAHNSSQIAVQKADRGIEEINSAEDIHKNSTNDNNQQLDIQKECDETVINQCSILADSEGIKQKVTNANDSISDILYSASADIKTRIEHLKRFARSGNAQEVVTTQKGSHSNVGNAAIIIGALVGTGLLLGVSPMLLAAGTLMSALAIGRPKEGESVPGEIGSGTFFRTGSKIQEINLLDEDDATVKMSDLENKVEADDSETTIERKLPWKSKDEEKLMWEYQRINHPLSEFDFGRNFSLKTGGKEYLRDSSSLPTNTIPPLFHVENIKYRYGNTHDKIRESATDILMNQGSMVVHYDPIGNAIDKAANKEFYGHWGLSPEEKSQLRTEVQFEKTKRLESPNYLMPSSNNISLGYSSLSPVY